MIISVGYTRVKRSESVGIMDRGFDPNIIHHHKGRKRFMGKDSEFYKNKSRNQKGKLRELMKELPGFAKDYIYSKEMDAQVSTLISYTYDLLTFFRFLVSNNPVLSQKSITELHIEDMEQLTSEDIMEYERFLEFNMEGEMHENGKKAIARKLSPLRGMYQYLLEHEYIQKNPMLLVKLPKLKKDKNIVRMNENEVQEVLNTVEFGSFQLTKQQLVFQKRTKIRDLAIMTLLLGTGIRVSECAGLDVNDVDLNANTITIVRKGGGQDILYFSEEVHDALQAYVEGNRETFHPDQDSENAFFLSLKHKRMSVDAIEHLVKKYAKIAVPNKKITPHKLRSTYGTALYRETGDIRLVADVLGHENINTTISYYAAIEDEHKQMAAKAVVLRKDQH